MPRPLFQALLALLFAIPAAAQRNFPYRKLYPDPNRPGMLLDSSQIKLLQIRSFYISKELARLKDSVKKLQTLSASANPNSFNTKILSNSCGLKASFTPANDTTLYTGQAISFTNTSQNADSYEWINDVYNRTTTTDYTNFVPAVGVTQIMLIAHRGTCADTAVTYVVRNGTPPTDQQRMSVSYGLPNTEEWASALVNAKTDGYLLAGLSGTSDLNGYTAPYFVRVSETGCILWSKMLNEQGLTVISSMITTYDSGFVLQVVLRNSIDNSYLLKLDKNGNVLWTRNYTGAYSLSYITAIREMADHSLMLLSGQWSQRNFLLTHVSEQGNFLWQKKYGINDNDQANFVDLVEKNGYAYVAGSYYQLTDVATNQWHEFPMLFKVDAATGNLQWSQGYSSPNKYFTCSGIQFFKDGLILNCFSDSMVDFANNKWGNYQSLLETDLDGNMRDGKLIFNPVGIDIANASSMIVTADNTIELLYSGTNITSLQPGFLPQTMLMRLDAGKNILWQETYLGYFIGTLLQAVPAPLKGMAMIGQKMNSLSNPFYGFSVNLLMAKLDSNGAAAGPFCDIYQTGYTMQDLVVTPYSPGTPLVTDESLQVADHPVITTNTNSELRYNCPDYVPFCSFMKLSGKSAVCNMKDTLEFVAHKDPSCADPVKWTYDISNIKTVYEDGGRTRLLFKAPGTYTIRAEKPFPCTSIADSILVNVAPALINYTLGGDTTLCAGDSITLRPQGKYDLYQWQDLSSNDSFKVKTTGRYVCLVTDSCGNTKADSVQVNFRPSVPVNLGAPLLKCVSDSLTIVPPPGFQQYVWTPEYNLIPSVSGSVILYPRKDTSYLLTVHDNNGCTGTALLNIQIYASGSVALGNDTAICAGDYIIFSAGANFQSYVWSNGGTTNSIVVQDAGKYSVLAKDQYGCVSKDTVTLAVYPLPAVQITGGIIICKDQSLMLDAGAGFSTYAWQDGTITELYKIVDTGYYWVQVSDLHHCVASDSIHIAQYAPTPRGFLPTDTVVCLYRGGVIESTAVFAQYNWSTGETGRSIQVKTAGQYTLQVVDEQGCRGMESIQVETKDCEALLVFPNAFTPNHDGVNDVFRLKYPGYAADYQLQIFNRWGQMMFSTSDPYGEWDGNYVNELQPAGTYVWIARFTDRSGKKQKLQGTVVLIR